uniref:Uncharacterized protein n=1 Tax=Tanacetum cinerariifolium TaxID=118510 RepID=A0A699L8X4_TANCI|nr:hypothetical protein [Tanacetum cinerariifolium]
MYVCVYVLVYELYGTISSRIMNPIIVQQRALYDSLVALADCAMIGKCNMRIDSTKTHKEATYQVVPDTPKLSPFYNAFLITANLDKKKFKVRVEVFRKVLQICHRLSNQEFVQPPAHERTFAFIINKCLSRKTIGIDQLDYRELKSYRSIGRRRKTGVTIRDTLTVKKKKTPKQSLKLKGMEMLFDAAMPTSDTRKAIKANKRDLKSQHHTGGSSKGAGSKPKVPDELKGKKKDTNKGVGSKPEVPDVSKAKSLDQESENMSWGDSEC